MMSNISGFPLYLGWGLTNKIEFGHLSRTYGSSFATHLWFYIDIIYNLRIISIEGVLKNIQDDKILK